MIAHSGRVGNLPIELSSFVGRDAELAILATLAAGARLLTLVGPGGAGKSRLALHLANRIHESYVDGVWVVDLAPLTDPGLVVPAIVDVLDIREQLGQAPLTALLDSLRTSYLLLLLDNAEHVAAASAEVVAALLRDCPDVHILVTSRQPLEIVGETTWRVPPLTLPALKTVESDQLMISEAVRLFIARATARAPGFQVTDRNLRLIAQICRRVDGLPLTIEIVAARVEGFDPADIATRLETGLALRARGQRTAPPRQQTLRATLDWSFALLGEAERVLLRRLAVFAASWTMAEAEAVCSDALLPAGAVAEVLHRLVAASLVILEHHTGGVRYRLLEIVREYALELLAGADEAASFRQRHADHVLELAELAPRDGIFAAHAAMLEGQQEELRAALAWALEMGEAELGLRMVAGAYPLWYARGHYAEGRRWIERLLALPAAASAPTRAFVERCMGRLLMNQGDYADAETWFHTSLERHARIDDRLGVALCQRHLGTLAMWRGELDKAAEQLAEAARILHALGHPGQFAALFNGALVALELGNPGRTLELAAEIEVRGQAWQPTVASAWVLLLRALVVARNGNAQQAEELLTQALQIKQPLAYKQLRLILLTDLAHVLLDQGKTAQAQSALGESVHGAYDAGERMRFIRGIEGIARSAASNQLQAAVRLAGAAAGLRAAMGALPWPRDNWRSESWLPVARQKLGERAYKSAWIDGQVLTEGEALALARSMLDSPTEARDQPVSPLTARETEVAALLARGLSTTDIAADLVISVATVRVHVEHILAKLDLHSRTQVAVWARESGLLAGQRV